MCIRDSNLSIWAVMQGEREIIFVHIHNHVFDLLTIGERAEVVGQVGSIASGQYIENGTVSGCGENTLELIAICIPAKLIYGEYLREQLLPAVIEEIEPAAYGGR